MRVLNPRNLATLSGLLTVLGSVVDGRSHKRGPTSIGTITETPATTLATFLNETTELPVEATVLNNAPLLFPVAEYDFPRTSERPEGSWVYRGSSRLRGNELVIIPSTVGSVGGAWNPMPITAPHVEIDLDLRIRGNVDVGTSADGFALWLLNSTLPVSLLNFPNQRMWHLMGYNPGFSGLCMAFSTTARDNTERQSISYLSNNGLYLDSIRSVPSKNGLYLPFKEEGTDEARINIWMSLDGRYVSGYVKQRDEVQWHRVFQVPQETPIKNWYLAITASNARLTSSEEAPVARDGLEVVLERFRVTTSMSELANTPKFFSQPKDLSLYDLLANHLMPEHEVTRYKMDTLQSNIEDKLAKHREEMFQKITENTVTKNDLTVILNYLKKASVVESKIDNLSARVQKAGRTTRFLLLGLGISCGCVGLFLYRKIIAFEKRHYL